MSKLTKKGVSVLLAVLMLLGCVLPGAIAADAADGEQIYDLQGLKDAIAAAPADGALYEIEIMADIQLDGQLTIATGQNIKIRSADEYTIKAAENTRLFYVSGGALTLEDFLMLEGAGEVRDRGCGIYVDGINASLVMNGGKISGNTAANFATNRAIGGGGVFVNNGAFIMNAGEISGNSTRWVFT